MLVSDYYVHFQVSSQKNEYHQSLQSQDYDQNAPLNNNRAYNIETSLNTNNFRERSSLPDESNDIANENDDDNTVPGVPGKDYPNYKTIPQTSFVCANKKPGGYYADMETGCQVCFSTIIKMHCRSQFASFV